MAVNSALCLIKESVIRLANWMKNMALICRKMSATKNAAIKNICMWADARKVLHFWKKKLKKRYF